MMLGNEGTPRPAAENVSNLVKSITEYRGFRIQIFKWNEKTAYFYRNVPYACIYDAYDRIDRSLQDTAPAWYSGANKIDWYRKHGAKIV